MHAFVVSNPPWRLRWGHHGTWHALASNAFIARVRDDELVVGRKCDRHDWSAMACDLTLLLTCASVPNSHRAIARARDDEPAVGRKCNRVDQIVVVHHPMLLLARICAPYLHCTTTGARDNELAFGRECNRSDPVIVACHLLLLLACARVPYTHRAISRSRGDEPAIRQKTNRHTQLSCPSKMAFCALQPEIRFNIEIGICLSLLILHRSQAGIVTAAL